MGKYISEELTDKKIEELTNEYIYLLAGECGSGKTTAIMKNLYEYAKKEDKQILYLCNRTNLRIQLGEEYLVKVNDRITLGMYQKITIYMEKNYSLPFHNMKYDFVVIDEAHLIFDASDYDINPMLFVDYLNNIDSKIIALSGTPKGFRRLEKYFKRSVKTLREVDKLNNHVRKIILTESKKLFKELKYQRLLLGEKNLELTDSTKSFKKYKEENKMFKAACIASVHRKDINSLMDLYDWKVWEGITRSQRLLCNALMATTALEVGINIITKENYIVSFDSLHMPSTIVQFVSRIRVKRNDNFHSDLLFLLKKPSKKILEKMKSRLEKINQFYKFYGDYRVICKKQNLAFGTRDYYEGLVISRENNPITKECLEEKIAFYEKAINSENLFKFYEEILIHEYPNVEIINLEKEKIENYFEELISNGREVILSKEDKLSFRKSLKKLGIQTEKKTNIPSINLINKFLKKINSRYMIKQDKDRFNGEKEQRRYWEIVKHVT